MGFIVIMIILFDSQHGSVVNNKSITANVFCLSLMSCLNAREHPWSVMYACSIPVFHRTEF